MELTPAQRAARKQARTDLNRRLAAAEAVLFGAPPSHASEPPEWLEDEDAPISPPARRTHQRPRREAG
jgi:hypothetical protein